MSLTARHKWRYLNLTLYVANKYVGRQVVRINVLSTFCLSTSLSFSYCFSILFFTFIILIYVVSIHLFFRQVLCYFCFASFILFRFISGKCLPCLYCSGKGKCHGILSFCSKDVVEKRTTIRSSRIGFKTMLSLKMMIAGKGKNGGKLTFSLPSSPKPTPPYPVPPISLNALQFVTKK